MRKMFGKKNKKGQLLSGFNMLLGVTFILLIMGMILAFGSSFIADQKADLTTKYGNDSTAVAVLNQTEAANLTLAESQGTLTTVGVIIVIIGVLIGLYAMWRRSQGTA